MAIRLIDTCCNLSHSDFQKRERYIIERSLAAGVSTMIVPSSSVQEAKELVALAARHPEVYAAVGVHPHCAQEWGHDSYDTLAHLAQCDKVVAIGEAGLDYCRNYSPPDMQRLAFERQIELAVATGLPLLMHQRDAHDDFISLLKPWRSKLRCAVIHCFCLLYTSPSPRDRQKSRMPSSA